MERPLRHIRSNSYHMMKKIVKIVLAAPEIIGLKRFVLKKMNARITDSPPSWRAGYGAKCCAVFYMSTEPLAAMPLFVIQGKMIVLNKKHLKNVGPIRHCERPHAHSPDVATGTVARRLRIDVHDDNDGQRRRRRQRQRQRVTEGTAMAPWNGPNQKKNRNVYDTVTKTTVVRLLL